MVSVTILRKKWKYLRDQFSVECSEIKTPRLGDAAETATEPKWPYFKRMLFLKDIVTPRASSSNLKPKAPTVTDDGEVEREHDISLFVDGQETNGIDLNVAEKETPNKNVTDTQSAEFHQPASPTASQHRKRKRVMATNTLYNEKILQLEQQKINTIQSAFQREPDNDDIMFFKSLLPFVSKIPTEQKLSFRTRIQQVVEEFAFPRSPLEQHTRPSTIIVSNSLSSPSESTISHDSTSYDSVLSAVDHYVLNLG